MRHGCRRLPATDWAAMVQAVMDWDSRHMANNNTANTVSPPSVPLDTVQERARSLKAGANSNRSGWGSSGAVSNASFRRKM